MLVCRWISVICPLLYRYIVVGCPLVVRWASVEIASQARQRIRALTTVVTV